MNHAPMPPWLRRALRDAHLPHGPLGAAALADRYDAIVARPDAVSRLEWSYAQRRARSARRWATAAMGHLP